MLLTAIILFVIGILVIAAGFAVVIYDNDMGILLLFSNGVGGTLMVVGVVLALLNLLFGVGG